MEKSFHIKVKGLKKPKIRTGEEKKNDGDDALKASKFRLPLTLPTPKVSSFSRPIKKVSDHQRAKILLDANAWIDS